MSQSLNETVFRAIDPDLRTSRELFRWKSPKDAFEFDVSPDGTKMVVREPGEGGKVFVVDLPGGGNRRELSSSEPNLGSWRWLPDGKGWLVTRIVLPRGCEVLRVDESGATTVLWKSDSERLGDPEISRDGRHVAFAKYSSESNAWILRF